MDTLEPNTLVEALAAVVVVDLSQAIRKLPAYASLAVCVDQAPSPDVQAMALPALSATVVARTLVMSTTGALPARSFIRFVAQGWMYPPVVQGAEGVNVQVVLDTHFSVPATLVPVLVSTPRVDDDAP